jgi:hypothetical protein
MVDLKVDIWAESALVAKDIEQAIRGLIALVNLQFAESSAQSLIPNITVAVDGDKVHIDAAYPTAKLVDILKKRESFRHLSFDNSR